MTKEIPLTQGKVALVDDEDYEYLNQWKWYAIKSTNTFYAYRYKNHKNIIMHRILTNAQKGEEVDHINHNGLDNRKCNLRVCSHKNNTQNSKSYKNREYKGVWYNKRINKWVTAIMINDKSRNIGYFETLKEAQYAYDEAATYHYGEFANLNFPDLTSEDRNVNSNVMDRIYGSNIRSSYSNNTSGFKGVTQNKYTKKWVGSININGKRLHLGTFMNKEDAARAYDQKAKELLGNRAYLNFPEHK